MVTVRTKAFSANQYDDMARGKHTFTVVAIIHSQKHHTVIIPVKDVVHAYLEAIKPPAVDIPPTWAAQFLLVATF